MTNQRIRSRRKADSTVDVAIVGGGVAGTYAAYRLSQAHKNKDSTGGPAIALFESSDRIGGRLWSYEMPDLPSLRAELGGIGFSKFHQNVFNLCKDELQLDVEPCGPFTQQCFYYLRRHRFIDADFLSSSPFPGVIPYFFTDEEKESLAKGWQVFVAEVIDKSVVGSQERIQKIIDAFNSGNGSNLAAAFKEINRSISDLRDACVEFSDGSKEKIFDVGFWNLLEDKMSTEAWQLISYCMFALSFFRNWNTYDSVLGYLGSELGAQFNPLYWQLKNGFQELPLTLARRFEELDQGRGLFEINMNHTVKSLHRTIVDDEPYILMEVLNPDGATMEVVARSVILALPKRALQMLDEDSVMYESTSFADQLEAVEASPAFKTYLSFDEAWWKDTFPRAGDICDGYATTDLPIRACYYMGVDEGSGKALLNASLSDEFMTQFWSGYLQTTLHGDLPPQFEGRNSDQIASEVKPPERMIREIMCELAEMHELPMKNMPTPCDAICFDWTDDPYGGGWHSWRPYVKSWEVAKDIRCPVPEPETRVFICGEAYSSIQGWVEGALNTTEMVLKDYFDLERPTWIPDGYPIGP